MTERRNKDRIFPYVVVLKKKHHRSSWLISLFSALIFLLLLINRLLLSTDKIAITLILLLFIIMSIRSLIQFRKGEKFDHTLILLLPAGALFLLPFMATLAFAIVAYTGYLANQPEEIGFGDEEIVMKRFFKRTIRWNQLQNVVLKDGLLTLDFRDNRVIQVETDDEEDNDEYDVSEEEFNAYCRSRIGT